jgi:hypothetical protein
MNLAYIIIAYKNLHQVQRLIGCLEDSASQFIVIVDRKTPVQEFEAFHSAVAGRPHVHVLRRHAIEWGGLSLTLANVICLRELLERGIPFDYVFSMSGQDYPIASTAVIRKVLSDAEGNSFIEHMPFPVDRWIDGGQGRIFSWNFILSRKRVIQLPKATRARNPVVRFVYAALNRVIPSRGNLPMRMQPFGGSMHWALSREAAEYVDHFLRCHPEYTRRFRWTLVSDEIFFQTILANSPLKQKLISDDMRYQRWPEPHSPSPSVLTMNDLPALRRSGKLFARKFDVCVDAKVLDAIDEMLSLPAIEGLA